jgi:hypothetical protein
MEFSFQNFEVEYNVYQHNETNIGISIYNAQANVQRTAQLEQINNEFKNLDVKMRLAFGIREIRLNNVFVSDKEGDLKVCHLLYYKLADLWFAYETYIRFFGFVIGTGKNKIIWLDNAVHNEYAISQPITIALSLVNDAFNSTYNTNVKKAEFCDYLAYCSQQANGTQRTRLNALIARVAGTPFNLTHSDVLTIVYSIRNNFVHNGETTVVPNIFGYANKSRLLRILYPYLSIILLKSTNLTCSKI